MPTQTLPIDLRSDTVTRPSPEMRAAMNAAKVGDDQYGDDPTVNELQEQVAALLGKEAALWLPTGTMANQVALQLLTRPGDDIIVSRESHAGWHEAGGSGANAGVQLTEIGQNGVFTVDEFRQAIKPRLHDIFPPTTLVEIENTHNRAGGIIFPQAEAERICAEAKAQEIATYLDGARLWNAAIATQQTVATLAASFDMVMVSFSKGLGAPGGSMLAGPQDLIKRGVRSRRMLGGAMRQVGFFAAAALYALEHNIDRLADDHAHAGLIANQLVDSPYVILGPATVQTNILVFALAAESIDAPSIVEQCRGHGLWINALGPRTIRAITHLDASREQCQKAAEILRGVIDSQEK